MRAIIYGQVQGVGYRAFAERLARDYELTGYATNLPEGSVEIIAVGNANTLAVFAKGLSEGPQSASVELVQTSFSEHEERFTDFFIR